MKKNLLIIFIFITTLNSNPKFIFNKFIYNLKRPFKNFDDIDTLKLTIITPITILTIFNFYDQKYKKQSTFDNEFNKNKDNKNN